MWFYVGAQISESPIYFPIINVSSTSRNSIGEGQSQLYFIGNESLAKLMEQASECAETNFSQTFEFEGHFEKIWFLLNFVLLWKQKAFGENSSNQIPN